MAKTSELVNTLYTHTTSLKTGTTTAVSNAGTLKTAIGTDDSSGLKGAVGGTSTKVDDLVAKESDTHSKVNTLNANTHNLKEKLDGVEI